MTHHRHEAGDRRPSRTASPSLLRMSAAARLLLALAIASVLWGATWWIMS